MRSDLSYEYFAGRQTRISSATIHATKVRD
jgi:hypothetical protein